MKEPKLKKCIICLVEFKQFKTTEKVCSLKCAIEHAKNVSKEVKAKEWNKTKKIKKESLKTKQDYIKELQVVFNRFIRLRDKDYPCISCGKDSGKAEQAGHYRSTGSCPELRFCEDNVHGQCIKCNMYLSGNLINYRLGLIERCGLALVDWLELNHEPKHYTINELIELKEKYKSKIRSLKEK